jgi:two-component system response regulator YesN
MSKARIYLVDDEQPVLDGLSVTLRKGFPDLKICGTARSGMEALAGIAAEKPDIIIMDVRMPGMSGIDALREVNKILPDTVSILLTAYERFDIAQDAYALGVYKYLVKPVSQELLTRTIAGALDKLEEIKAAGLKAAEEREKEELLRPLLETGFMYTLIMGDPASPLLYAYAERLGLLKNGAVLGHFAVIFKYKGSGLKDVWLGKEEIGRIKQEITNRLDCVIGSLMGGILPVFVGNDKIIRTRDVIKAAFTAINNPALMYAIGSVRRDQELSLSWSDALDFIHEDFSQKEAPPHDTALEKELILDSLKKGNIAGLRKAFTTWASSGPESTTLKRAVMAGALCALSGGGAEEILAAGHAQLAIDTGDQEGAAYAAHTLIYHLSRINAVGDLPHIYGDHRIQTALRFVAEHYSEPISLEDAAAQVGLSPAHLSRLFPAETGATFTSHLSEHRIDRACRELSSGRYSIKEIAFLCGYPDANYFSRAFKKAMGITPSEYVKKQERNLL